MRPALPPSTGWLALVAVLLAGMTLVGAHIGAVASTETRYSEMGREMLETGDWVVPRLNGAPLLEKPPWIYWVTAASEAVLGVNDFAPRVPSVLAGGLFLLVLAGPPPRASRAWGETEAEARARGRLAALALATMPAFLLQTIAISIDPWLVLSTTVAGAALLEADRAGGKPALRWTLLLHASFGFGMVAKGPLTWALAFGAAVVVCAIRRNARLLRPFVHPLGLLLFAAVTLPWYLALEAALPGTIRELVTRRLFGGMASSADFHSHSWWYAWAPLLGTFPWLAALWPSIGSLRRAGRWRHGIGLVALALALAAPVLFTFSASRLPSYASPAFPWLAFLVAMGAPVPGSDPAGLSGAGWRREISRAAIGMAVVLAAGLAYWAISIGSPSPVPLVVAGVAVVAAGVLSVPRRVGALANPTARAALVVLPFMVGIAAAIESDPTRVDACKGLWQAVERERKPGEELGVALNYNGDWGLFPWYSREEVRYFGYPSAPMIVAPEKHRKDLFLPIEDLRPWFSSPQRRWLLVRTRDVEKLAGGLPAHRVAKGSMYTVLSNRPSPGESR